VQYDKGTLIEKVRRTIEVAMRSGQISLEDSARLRRHYEQGLQEYTYLSRDESPAPAAVSDSSVAREPGGNGAQPTPYAASAPQRNGSPS